MKKTNGVLVSIFFSLSLFWVVNGWAQETIDFEGLQEGTILEEVFGNGGSGPIFVNGFNPSMGSEINAAVIFDSSCPPDSLPKNCSGGDQDLGSPNLVFGGPGIGSGGIAGSTYENNTALGNILIVAENLIDDDNDNLVDNPDDADLHGAAIDFDFSTIGTVTIFEITIIDIEASEPFAVVDLLDKDSNPVASFDLPQTGDNGVATFVLGPTSGVTFMTVTLGGSGAIANVVFDKDEYCGNSTLDPGEECDDGNNVNSDGCRNDCTLPYCGDGILDPNEQCDDGNNIDGDGCQANCVFQECGDGILDPDEECDDGNNINGDGCSATCRFEECGNGILDPGEECDDGNDLSGDGCRSDCTMEICGDSILDPNEQCDDGNNIDGDGCQADCTLPECGDGILDPNEECDDGNTTNGDGCDANCNNEQFGDEGCTPGFWKNHLAHWEIYSPDDEYNDVFDINASFGNLTLNQVVNQGGGGEKALGRHAVAALLNSVNGGVTFAHSTAHVIVIVQDAYDAGDFEGAKNMLEIANEKDCPLSGGNTTSYYKKPSRNKLGKKDKKNKKNKK